MPTFLGRIGVLAGYYEGSYDIYNFWSVQPAKDIIVQLTYESGRVPANFYYEIEYTTTDEQLHFLEGDLIPFDTIELEGTWQLEMFLIQVEPNPYYETFRLLPDQPINIDQVVIDTICYVPEPATLLLFGLGGLTLLRKRRR